jgi:hypothetical protein
MSATEVRLDPAVLEANAAEYGSIAQAIESAVQAASSALSGTGAMAGEAELGEAFALDGANGYDNFATDNLQAPLSVSGVLYGLETALINTARTYAAAQKPGALEQPTIVPASATTPVQPGGFTVPSAYGEGGNALPFDLGEFGDLIQKGLDQVGVKLPSGDPDALQSAADAWAELESALSRANARIAGLHPLAGMSLPQQGTIDAATSGLQTSLGDIVTSVGSLRQKVSDYRSQLVQAKATIQQFIEQMLIEIAIEAGLTLALSLVSGGLAAGPGVAKIMLTIVRWVNKIKDAIDKLRDAIRALSSALRIRNAKYLTGALKQGVIGSIASGGSTITMNVVHAGDPHYQQQSVGMAFLTGGVSSAVSSPVTRLIGGGSGPITRAVTGVSPGGSVSRITRTTAGDIAGSAAGEVAADAIDGGGFNPLNSAIAGALMGGVMSVGGSAAGSLPNGATPQGMAESLLRRNGIHVAGGPGAASPSANAGAAATSPAIDAPAPGAGGANPTSPSGAGGGRTDYDGPTPGGAAAGAATAAGGGAGTSDYDGPTPGGADPGAAGGDAGSVDVSNDAPTAPDALPDASTDAPTTDAPSTEPGTDAPTADHAATPDDAGATTDPASQPDAASNDTSAADPGTSQADASGRADADAPTHADAPAQADADTPGHTDADGPSQADAPTEAGTDAQPYAGPASPDAEPSAARADADAPVAPGDAHGTPDGQAAHDATPAAAAAGAAGAAATPASGIDVPDAAQIAALSDRVLDDIQAEVATAGASDAGSRSDPADMQPADAAAPEQGDIDALGEQLLDQPQTDAASAEGENGTEPDTAQPDADAQADSPEGDLSPEDAAAAAATAAGAAGVLGAPRLGSPLHGAGQGMGAADGRGGRTPRNQDEQRIADMAAQLRDDAPAPGDVEAPTQGPLSPSEQRAFDDLVDRGVLRDNGDGTYDMNAQAYDVTSPDHCDPAEMQRQFDEAAAALRDMPLSEWIQRRADFINHPDRYRDVTGSTAAQRAAKDDWIRDRAAEIRAADPETTRKQAETQARQEARSRNATHRLDMVAGGNPRDISGMGGAAENQAIGNIFKNDLVPGMQRSVIDLLDGSGLDPRTWNRVRMPVDITVRDAGGNPASPRPLTPPSSYDGVSRATADAGPSGHALSTSPAGPAPVGETHGADVAPEADPAALGGPDDPQHPEGAAQDGEPTSPDAPAADPAGSPQPQPHQVADTMHHPGLDQHYPRLEQGEAPVTAAGWVNSTGFAADAGRYGNNCHYVVNALELRARGYNVVASPTVRVATVDPLTGATADGYAARTPLQMAQDWRQADGTVRWFEPLGDQPGDTPQARLTNLTQSWPVGARGFIGGMWTSGGGGHVFTVVREADGFRLLDGQVGSTDASSYLDDMRDVQVLRVDDLVPTEGVLSTARPNSAEEYADVTAWGAATDGQGRVTDPTAVPPSRVQHEIAANERWRATNEAVIAQYEAILADPAASADAKQSASGWIAALTAENTRLKLGLERFLADLAPAPATPQQPGDTVPNGA